MEQRIGFEGPVEQVHAVFGAPHGGHGGVEIGFHVDQEGGTVRTSDRPSRSLVEQVHARSQVMRNGVAGSRSLRRKSTPWRRWAAPPQPRKPSGLLSFSSCRGASRTETCPRGIGCVPLSTFRLSRRGRPRSGALGTVHGRVMLTLWPHWPAQELPYETCPACRRLRRARPFRLPETVRCRRPQRR